MSNSTISRDLPPSSETPTLADRVALTLADETLTLRQRQDQASALRTLGRMRDRVLGKVPGTSLAELPAHPGILRAPFARVSAAMAGLTPARLANTKSLVRANLKHAGLARRPGRYNEPWAPAWDALIARLDPVRDKRTRIGLSRLGHYCTEKGISPEQISDQVLTAFLADMETGGLGKPRRVHRTACVVWNKAAAAIEGWPQGQLAVPSYTRTYVVPRTCLQPTLTAEMDAWLERLECPDILDGLDILDESDFRPLRPASIATRRQQLYGYVSALIHHGHAADQLRTLADVIQPDKIKDGLRFIIAHARGCVDKPGPDTGRGQAGHTARMLAAVARHWVKADTATLTRLTAICRKLRPKGRGLKEKNSIRLDQFDDPDAVDRLVLMPEELFTSIRRVRRPSRAEGLKAQLAVAVQLLQMVPLRIENLAGLSIGSNMVRAGVGNWRLAFLGDETKNEDPIKATLPAEAGQMLDEYIGTYRPLLLHGTSDWLFPGQKAGSAKRKDTLGKQITKGILDFTGLVVNPHLFRHICAKLYLKDHPGAYGVVRLALSHRSINTTIENYCGSEGVQALAHFDAHILALRARARARKPAAPSRRRGR